MCRVLQSFSKSRSQKAKYRTETGQQLIFHMTVEGLKIRFNLGIIG
jgi:hypothetical protein